MYKFLIAVILLGLSTSFAQAKIEVNSLVSTQRVLREEMPPSTKGVHLYSAKNEWRSFQILVRADSPTKITSVELGELRGPGGASIPASGIRLYREHQFHIMKPSYQNKDFKPGWYPDALIPFCDPTTGKPLSGARFSALPFDLPANETHGFWVDVFVPAETHAGDYTGWYKVGTVDGKTITAPVILTVWNFKLPDTPTFQTSFGSPASNLRGYYEKWAKLGKTTSAPDWSAVDTQCSEMLKENRFNAVPTFTVAPVLQADGSFVVPTEQVNSLRKFIDRYHINLLMLTHPDRWINDPEKERGKLLAWLKAWDLAAVELKRPQVTLAIYLIDEPNDAEQYRYAQRWGRAIRAAHSVVKVLVVEQPKTQDPAWGDLYGAVDIWCPLFPLFDGPAEAQRQALRETIWTYTALCQGSDKPTPWWQTDFPLLNYRVPAWISWRYRIKGLLYWASMTYWEKAQDPWTSPATYGEGANDYLYNGEGVLVYPGVDVGYDGIAPSMRLKALRDSIQDYEYMSILERAGKAADAQKVVLPLAESWYKWDKNPQAYDKARADLARLILSKR